MDKSNNIHDDTPVTLGKYTVTPMVKPLDDGRYGASVSIRSGQGSGMSDRVLRFTEAFADAAAAARYAVEQGLAWIREQGGSATLAAA
jgi:hypothetical protein